jgi:NAD(P)H-flavin reductase
MAATIPATPLDTTAAAIDPMVPRLYRVQRVRREIADTFTQEFEPLDGCDAPPFAAGQFNMLYAFGVGEIPISISGDPTRHGAPLVHTTRAVGTVSHAMHGLAPGDVIGVRGPFGSSWPVARAQGKDVVIAAGGIGLAPLRPAMYQILADREQFGKVVLLYGARTPADILYRRELEQWRAHFDLDVFVTVDRATASWRGSVGVVTRLIPRAPFDPQNTVAMVCGPEIMMRFTAAELTKRGVSAESIFLSMERNMKCAIGFCGHCQYGPYFVCKDGPVFAYSAIQSLLATWEV